MKATPDRKFFIEFTLLSDACFGRGDGVAGLVDVEVQHDEDGCPYLSGKTLRGLLVEECANIMFGLNSQQNANIEEWQAAADRLFGRPGSQANDQASLHIGDARLPADLRKAIHIGVQREELQRGQVLESLTTIRRQTALDPETGAPKDRTLRAVRLVLRGLSFQAELLFATPPTGLDLPLLAACTKALRRLGLGRSRGRGALTARLLDTAGQDVTGQYTNKFRQAVEVD